MRMTIGVIVAVFAATWMTPLAAHAQDTVAPGALVRASQSAVYYIAADGKRYAFPNEQIYRSWYADFSAVRRITDDALAAMPLGGVVTYRPGTRLVKITTDPKVYAVDRGGTLRWVQTEEAARAIYGSRWAAAVHDLPDAFFAAYAIGDPIADASAFNTYAVQLTVKTISENLVRPDASVLRIAPRFPRPPDGCTSDSAPRFSHDITPVSGISLITPPGAFTHGDGMPTSHSYIWTDGARVPIYAPTDVTFFRGSYSGDGVNPAQYGIDFRVSCEVWLRFGHVDEVVPAIAEQFPGGPKINDSTIGSWTFREVAFRAGDLLGYTRGTVLARNWDFGVYNSAAAPGPVNDFAVCPYDFYAEAQRSQFRARYGGGMTVAPTAPTTYCQ